MENKNKEKRVIELEVMDELEDSGVSSIALVDEPAIEKYFVYMREQKFVKPTAGESESDFMGRCVPAMIDEGKDQDQAVAMCISMYEEKFSYDTAGLPDFVEQAPKKKKDKFLEPNPCWEGYEAYGLKDDGTPNCIPIKSKKSTETKLAFAVEKDQQILVGPAMVPDMEILRRDEETGEIYYVKFSKDTIAKIQEKFMRETRLGATNLDHNENVHGGSFVFESWLVEDKNDKANSVYNLGVPVGTWMVKMKVTDPKVWEMVKEGKYQGFSIEGNFIDRKDYEQIQSEKDMIESIMAILAS